MPELRAPIVQDLAPEDDLTPYPA